MPRLTFFLILCALLAGNTAAPAQQVVSLARQPAVFATLRLTTSASRIVPITSIETAAPAGRRTRNGLIGGAIGAVGGLAVCTVISNLVNDGTGFSTCTWNGYVLTGAIGFGVGFAVGWML
jgi:hypothetical protein